MDLKMTGSEIIDTNSLNLWEALLDANVLKDCIPGCEDMIEVNESEYNLKLNLKVGAVGGSFEGLIKLTELNKPKSCKLNLSGGGSLGNGKGIARITIEEKSPNSCILIYEAEGNVGGLVAGVGQRVTLGVAKHLAKKFFSSLKKPFKIQS